MTPPETSEPRPQPVIAVFHTTAARARLYEEAVERAGGRPWVVLPQDGLSPEEVLARAHGLLLGGGGDIAPRWYGGPPGKAAADEATARRDALEIPLARHALETGFPLLGICRGLQVLNVAAGGGLLQEAPPGHKWSWEGGQMVSSYHRIFITPGSKLAAVVGSGGFVRVNSRHHQGVAEAQKAPGLLASAYSLEDGLIEALESPAHPCVLGVQFHPERRRELPPHFQSLFEYLVHHAVKRLEGAA